MILYIDKEQIPYRFEVELDGEVYTFEIHYNSECDFFTVDLYLNNEVIIYGEKLILNRPLFLAYADKRIPKTQIIPRDTTGTEHRITYKNLGETVFLYVGEENETVQT